MNSMKKFLCILLILPIVSIAQDCVVKKTIDPYTKEVKVSTGFMDFNKGINNFLLSIDGTKTDIDFFVALSKSTNAPCFDNSSTLSIVFEGTRSKANFRNTGSMNCEGLFHFIFRNNQQTNSYLQRLSTMKVKSFLFTGSNGKIKEVLFAEEHQETLMQKVSCLVAEAKALLSQQ